MHTHLKLSYLYKDGTEESLLMGAELFHILLELKDGVQLSDAASEDIFANLAIFTQRLAQEDSRELYAWNPIEDDKIMAGPAYLAAATPVITKMPTPITPPIPKQVKSKALSVRFRWCSVSDSNAWMS